MKNAHYLLITFLGLLSINYSKAFAQDCKKISSATGCHTDPAGCLFDEEKNHYVRVSHINPYTSVCVSNGKTCSEQFGEDYACVKHTYFTEECQGCPQKSCYADGGIYREPGGCIHQSCEIAPPSLGWVEGPGTCCDPVCENQFEVKNCATDYNGVCIDKNNSGGCCIALDPNTTFEDCAQDDCCADQTCYENHTCEPFNGTCTTAAECDNCLEPQPDLQRGWTDCNITAGNCCCSTVSRKSCASAGGFCIQAKDCENSLPRPADDWQETDCRTENGGTCCSVEQYLTPGCETAGDCHRDYIGCSYWELQKTKEWSQMFYNRAAAEQWLDSFNTTSDYSFDGRVTLKDLTFPIKGEPEKMIGYFPYGDPDGEGPSPDVIYGLEDLENHDFVSGPLLKLAPPEDAAEIANWIPAMLKNYKQFAIRLKYCGNSRTPEDDDTAVDPNNPDIGWPEIRGAVRGPWGLKQSMYNTTLDNGLWSWIARRPNQTEAEAIDEAKNLAASLTSGKSVAGRSPNKPPTAAPEATQEQNYYTILTQTDNYQTLGAVLGKITCPEVNPCPEDRRDAPQYDEDCVWYNGETVMASTFENISVNKDNSDTRIDTRTVGPVDIYTAHLSHSESIEMNADVRECNLAEYWPLKLSLFLNLLPPEEVLGSASKAPLSSTHENTWGKMELTHSDPNIQVLTDDDKIGKEITYLHASGWAKTAEELIMGFRDSVGVMRGYTHPPSSEPFTKFALSRPINPNLIDEIPDIPAGDSAELARQTARWANQKFGAGAGDCSIYLALTAGETGFGKNCGTCNAWQEYAKHPALNTTAERNALRTLTQIWEEADIRAQNSLAAEYIPENYAPEGVIGSCGGGALGISQFIPTTALRNLNDVGKPFDLWEPQTAMRAMAAELYKLGWRKGLSHAEKKEVLMKWNATDWWIEKMISTAQQYEQYCQ